MMRTRRALRAALMGLCLTTALVPQPKVAAISAGQVTFAAEMPFAPVDADCASGAGAHAMYLPVRIAKGPPGALTNLVARLDDFAEAPDTDPAIPTAFTLDRGQDRIQPIGDLDSDPRVVYWYINHPCGEATFTYHVTVIDLDDNSSVTSAALTISTREAIESMAQTITVLDKFPTVPYVGSVITERVDIAMGTSTGSILIQPAANVAFDSDCFQLIGTNVIPSGPFINAVTAVDKLYFAPITTSSDDDLSIYFHFKTLCASAMTVAETYFEQTSGQGEKYNGDFGACEVCTLQSADNVLTLTKNADITCFEGTSTPQRITYQVILSSSASRGPGQGVSIDTITDVLPDGATYVGLAPDSEITASNSADVPDGGATGRIQWTADPVEPRPTSSSTDNYGVDDGGVVTLKYLVDLAVPGVYTNTAFAETGNVLIDETPNTTDDAPAAVTVGSCPDTTIVKIKVNHDRNSAKAIFTSTPAGATFECKLDDGAFEACESGVRYKHMKRGMHTFYVRATASGLTDPTPAEKTFRVR